MHYDKRTDLIVSDLSPDECIISSHSKEDIEEMINGLVAVHRQLFNRKGLSRAYSQSLVQKFSKLIHSDQSPETRICVTHSVADILQIVNSFARAPKKKINLSIAESIHNKLCHSIAALEAARREEFNE